MPLETGDYIEDLNENWPLGSDPKSQGDDHLRLLKKAIQGSFPNTAGPWSTTNPVIVGAAVQPNHAVQKSVTDALKAELDKIPNIMSWGLIQAGAKLAGSDDWNHTEIVPGQMQIVFDDPASSKEENFVFIQQVGFMPFLGDYFTGVEQISTTTIKVWSVISGTTTDAAMNFVFVRWAT